MLKRKWTSIWVLCNKFKKPKNTHSHSSSERSKMSENALSLRRATHLDNDEEEDSHQGGDGSKSRKHFSIAIRISNYLTRTGYICPIILLVIAILVICSLFLHSRDLICVSSIDSFDRIARTRFFGLEGLDSDFGALGVPWCKLSLCVLVFDLILLDLYLFGNCCVYNCCLV